MSPHVDESLVDQLALADILLAGREKMLEPQDLPGRYGRLVRAIDHVLDAIKCSSVVGGGWAVWRHGYVNRVTHDIDIVLPADRIDDFLQVASLSGFDILQRVPGRWPKLEHQETNIGVDILPEGERPGIPPDYAPTTIPSPKQLGASGLRLTYMQLPGLIELKLAAGRLKDRADVLELIRQNREFIPTINAHLTRANPQYAEDFSQLVVESERDDGR